MRVSDSSDALPLCVTNCTDVYSIHQCILSYAVIYSLDSIESFDFSAPTEQGAMKIQDIPTEVLLVIFDSGTLDLLQQDDGDQLRVRTASFSLPRLEHVLAYHLTLSRVCRLWRTILLEHKRAWSYVYLGHRAFLHPNFSAIDILHRSSKHPISLHCAYSPSSMNSGTRMKRKAMSEDMKLFFSPHIHRIGSLRVVGPRVFLSAILKTFHDHMTFQTPISVSPRSLTRLHLIYRKADPALPEPIQLPGVLACLTHLRVCGATVLPSSQFHFQEVIMEGGAAFLQMAGIHTPIHASAKNFVLHETFVQGLSSIGAIDPTSITSLTLSNIRADRPSHFFPSTPTPSATRAVYTDFFTPFLNASIETLRLSKLDQNAIFSLIQVLTQSLAHQRCLDLKDLYMEDLDLENGDVEILAKSFPRLSCLELNLKCGQHYFSEVWRNGLPNGEGAWPMLEEVLLNGVCQKRML